MGAARFASSEQSTAGTTVAEPSSRPADAARHGAEAGGHSAAAAVDEAHDIASGATPASAHSHPSPAEEPVATSMHKEQTSVGIDAAHDDSRPGPARHEAIVEPAETDYLLPVGSLQAIAQGAGLQWVNSDDEKIRAVQAQMAASPAPVHVPREIRRPERIDEGPLVLVETRKDLSQVRLPFETQGPAA
jgi:ribonuclease E